MAENNPHPPHRSGKRLADIILGGQDGLVSILGLLLGLSAATEAKRIVIAGGLATIVAETMSMAAVAYTSMMATRDHYAAERKREVQEIKDVPEQERQEIVDIYEEKGFSGDLLNQIVDHITAHDDLWLDTMMREELKLQPVEKRDVYNYALVVGAATLAGGLLPMIPYFFIKPASAIIISLIISALALAGIGSYKARANSSNQLKNILQMVLIGMVAAVVGYAIGYLFKG